MVGALGGTAAAEPNPKKGARGGGARGFCGPGRLRLGPWPRAKLQHWPAEPSLPAMEEAPTPDPAPALWDWSYLDRCFARHRVCISFGLWICASSCWIAAHTL